MRKISLLLFIMILIPIQGFAAILYFSDFEADNGGLTGTLDWEWASYSWRGSTCSTLNYPPSAMYSGARGWGTVLNDCYNNIGNNDGYDTCNNSLPSDDSILSFTVDLTGQTTVEMSWFEWVDLFQTWDWGEVYVDGVVVYQHCDSGAPDPSSWEKVVIDLSPYAGAPVDIEFHMMASTVVEHAGWYIDDLMVYNMSTTPTSTPTSSPTPTPTSFAGSPTPRPVPLTGKAGTGVLFILTVVFTGCCILRQIKL